MIPLQVISVIFGLLMLYVVRIHKRKNHLQPFEFGMWMGLWSAFIFVAIFPQTIQGVTEKLNIARVFDLLVMVSMMIIVFITFLNRMTIQKLENKLESLIRGRAIDEKQKKSTKGSRRNSKL